MNITDADRRLLNDAGKDCAVMRARCNAIWVLAVLAVEALDRAATEAACIAAGAAVIAGDAEIAVTPDAGRWLA